MTIVEDDAFLDGRKKKRGQEHKKQENMGNMVGMSSGWLEARPKPPRTLEAHFLYSILYFAETDPDGCFQVFLLATQLPRPKSR